MYGYVSKRKKRDPDCAENSSEAKYPQNLEITETQLLGTQLLINCHSATSRLRSCLSKSELDFSYFGANFFCSISLNEIFINSKDCFYDSKDMVRILFDGFSKLGVMAGVSIL